MALGLFSEVWNIGKIDDGCQKKSADEPNHFS
jgi:hypothetical protein